MVYNGAGGGIMDRSDFMDALYHTINTTEYLEIATLIEEAEDASLYVELLDGSRYHILVSPTDLHF